MCVSPPGLSLWPQTPGVGASHCQTARSSGEEGQGAVPSARAGVTGLGVRAPSGRAGRALLRLAGHQRQLRAIRAQVGLSTPTQQRGLSPALCPLTPEAGRALLPLRPSRQLPCCSQLPAPPASWTGEQGLGVSPWGAVTLLSGVYSALLGPWGGNSAWPPRMRSSEGLGRRQWTLERWRRAGWRGHEPRGSEVLTEACLGALACVVLRLVCDAC